MKSFPIILAVFGALTAVAVPAEASPIFTQTFIPTTSIRSDVSPVSGFPSGVFNADDFVLASTGTISSVTWRGDYAFSNTPPATDNFLIAFYSDFPGQPLFPPLAVYNPGNAVNRTATGTTVNGFSVFEYTATLGVPLALSAGTYWVAIVNDTTTIDTDDDWFWSAQSGIGNLTLSENLGATWSRTLISNQPIRDYFSLDGTLSGVPVPEPATLSLLALGLGAAGLLRRPRRSA